MQVPLQMVLQFGKEGCPEASYDSARVSYEGIPLAESACVAEGAPPRDQSSSNSTHWLPRLEVLCALLGASMVRISVRGDPQTTEEKANAQWLRHPFLLHCGVKSPVYQGTSLAADLVERKPKPGVSEVSDTASELDQAAATDSGRGARTDTGMSPPSSPSYPSLAANSTGSGPLPLETVATEPRGTSLVVQLCRRPSSSAARALASAMKRVVREDQGRDQSINEAVWAAAAAVIHHAGLTPEASEVARAELEVQRPSAADSVSEFTVGDSAVIISPALIRAWRSAQQTRFWLQSGASPGRDKTLLIERASFLLLLQPWALMPHGQKSLKQVSYLPSSRSSNLSADVDRGGGTRDAASIGVGRTLSASELVLQFLLRSDGPTVPTVATRDDRKADGANHSPAATADVRTGDPSILLNIIELRSARAMARSRGFLLAEQLLEGTTSDQAATEVLRAVADGLAAACLGPGAANRGAVSRGGTGQQAKAASSASGSGGERGSGDTTVTFIWPEENDHEFSVSGGLHFLSGVHCCDARSKTQLTEAVAKFLTRCARVLGPGGEDGDCQGGPTGGDFCERRRFSASPGNLQGARVEALRAVSMDYGWDDHDTLHSTEILPQIMVLVDDPDPSVAAAASEAMQALYRCVVLVKNEADDIPVGMEENRGLTSLFQQSFLTAIRSRIREIAETETLQRLLRLKSTRPSSTTTASVAPGDRALLEGALALHASQAGLVVSHFPISTRNTLSLWVSIPSAMPEMIMERENSTRSPYSGVDVATRADDEAATSEDAATTPTTFYVVAQGASCVVRRTPSLLSEYVGTLTAGEDLEVMAAHRQWANHPLVAEGRRVCVTRPMKGYASRYTADGSSLLQQKQKQHRRTASVVSMLERERGCALYVTPPAVLADEGTEGSRSSISRVIPTVAASEGGESRRSRTIEPRSSSAVPPGIDPEVSARSPSVGGILLFKGNEVLLGEEEAAGSWNRLGIEVTPAGALRFFVGAGGSSEVAVSSPDGALFGTATAQHDSNTAPGWSHIAVVQDLSNVSLFLNGRLCGSGSLPPHLQRRSRPDYGVTMKEVESAHPYPNSADDFWEVRIPGATSVTVRFDPKSRTEPEYDFVRFYRDHTKTQVGLR